MHYYSLECRSVKKDFMLPRASVCMSASACACVCVCAYVHLSCFLDPHSCAMHPRVALLLFLIGHMVASLARKTDHGEETDAVLEGEQRNVRQTLKQILSRHSRHGEYNITHASILYSSSLYYCH